MITNVLFKDRVFQSKKELFHALKDNEETIIGLKKSKSYKSIEKGQGIPNLSIKPKQESNKSTYKEGFIYPVISSTNWLDTHQDVHIKGCFTRTVKQQQGRVYYIDTHLKGLSNIIAKKNKIEMFYDDVDWRLLGKNIKGSTQSLLFKISEEDVKPEYMQLIREDKDLENSLAMMYKNIVMAINTTDSAFKENKEVFDMYIDSIANKEQALEDEIFFAVKEIAIMGEGSLCPVVGGSNSATSVIQINSQSEKSFDIEVEADDITSQIAADKSLQEFVKHLKI